MKKLGLFRQPLKSKLFHFKVGFLWRLCIVHHNRVFLPLCYFSEGAKVFTEGYEGYPSWFVNIFWFGGMAIFASGWFSFILFSFKMEK